MQASVAWLTACSPAPVSACGGGADGVVVETTSAAMMVPVTEISRHTRYDPIMEWFSLILFDILVEKL